MTKVIEVIETYRNRGKGTKDSVYRQVYQLWTKDGRLIFENDPFPEDSKEIGVKRWIKHI